MKSWKKILDFYKTEQTCKMSQKNWTHLVNHFHKLFPLQNNRWKLLAHVPGPVKISAHSQGVPLYTVPRGPSDSCRCGSTIQEKPSSCQSHGSFKQMVRCSVTACFKGLLSSFLGMVEEFILERTGFNWIKETGVSNDLGKDITVLRDTARYIFVLWLWPGPDNFGSRSLEKGNSWVNTVLHRTHPAEWLGMNSEKSAGVSRVSSDCNVVHYTTFLCHMEG